MTDLNEIITLFAGVSFIIYGVNSFSSQKMVLEFQRWGLEKKRKTSATMAKKSPDWSGLWNFLELKIIKNYPNIF